MIEAEDLIGVKLFYLKENSPGVIRTGGLTDPDFKNVHHHSGKKQIVQLREYYGLGITLSTEEGIFMTGNDYLEGIPFDEAMAKRCGFTEVDKYYYRLTLIRGEVAFVYTPQEDEFRIGNIRIPLERRQFLHQVMQLHYDLTGKVLKPQL